MQLAITILIWFMALASGLMAGIYFAFSVFGMRSFDKAGTAIGMPAMQMLNIEIVRSLFLPLFIGSSLASLALAVVGLAGWGGAGGPEMATGSAVYFVGMTLVTAIFNVPLNNRLAPADPASEEGARLWADYLTRWTRWNHIRTIACIAALIFFILAIAARSV